MYHSYIAHIELVWMILVAWNQQINKWHDLQHTHTHKMSNKIEISFDVKCGVCVFRFISIYMQHKKMPPKKYPSFKFQHILLIWNWTTAPRYTSLYSTKTKIKRHMQYWWSTIKTIAISDVVTFYHLAKNSQRTAIDFHSHVTNI